MDENEALETEDVATPIFSVYRRGYDPDQVDRYVQDHQRRLDDALHRASESERKLAAAVGQLRELHRRVAVYESEARNQQPPQLDTLGERVQRILQEAWEGAYNLRQEAEREVNELRDTATQEVGALRAQAEQDVEQLRATAASEASEIVDEATRRALHIRDETERRRQAYLERVERDRENAVAQITYLYDQRQGAIAELARLQATVEATIAEMVRSPLGRPAPGVAKAATAANEESSDLEPVAAGLFDGDSVDEHAAMPEGSSELAEDRGAVRDDGDKADPSARLRPQRDHGGGPDNGTASEADLAEPGENLDETAVLQADVPTGPMDVIAPEQAPSQGVGLFDGEQEGWS